MRLTYEVGPLETVPMTAMCWWSLYALTRHKGWRAGVLGGLAVGLRPDAALWIVVTAVGYLSSKRREGLPTIGRMLAGVANRGRALVRDRLVVLRRPSTGDRFHEDRLGRAHVDVRQRLWDRGIGQVIQGTSRRFSWRCWPRGEQSRSRDSERRECCAPSESGPLATSSPTPRCVCLAPPLVLLPAVRGAGRAVRRRSRAARDLDGPTRGRASGSSGPAGGSLVLTVALGSNVLDILGFRAEIPSRFYVGGRDRLYRQISQWLHEHTPEDATVAVTEPGTLAYYSDRTMVDLMGLATPEVGARMKRLRRAAVRPEWAAQRFSPTVFVVAWPRDKPFPGSYAARRSIDCGLRSSCPT